MCKATVKKTKQKKYLLCPQSSTCVGFSERHARPAACTPRSIVTSWHVYDHKVLSGNNCPGTSKNICRRLFAPGQNS